MTVSKKGGRLRQIVLVLAGFVAIMILAGFFVLHYHRPDHYKFLEGNKPVANFVIGRIETSTRSHSPKEVRVYSFKKDIESARGAAHKELSALGFNQKAIHDSDIWSSPKGIDVWIYPGRARSDNPLQPLDTNPEWVTVLIWEEIDDNLFNEARRWFGPRY